MDNGGKITRKPTRCIDGDRFHNSGEKLDHSGLHCGQLDYINETDNHSTRSEVMLLSRREATQYDNTPPGIETAMESAIAGNGVSYSGKPAVCKRPNVIVVVPSKITDRRVNCPVNVALTPQVMVHKSLGIGTQAEELFPEELEVVPEEMAEEASRGDLADNHPLNVYKLYTKTTVTNLPTDYDQIERLAPRRVLYWLKWLRRPAQRTLRLKSVCMKSWTKMRRPNGKCARNCLKYLSSWSAVGHARIFRTGRGGQNS